MHISVGNIAVLYVVLISTMEAVSHQLFLQFLLLGSQLG